MKRCTLLGLTLLLASCSGSLLEFPPGTQGILMTGLATTPAQTAVTITWSTNVPTTDLVEYGTASGTYTDSTIQTQTADTSHSVALSGLVEGTMYYFRVRSFHANLSDSVSGESSFATTSPTPPTLAQKQRGIWIFGGLTGNLISTTVGQVDLYDPVPGTWYPGVTTIPTPVSFAAASSFGGKLYLFGGFDSAGTVRNTVQIYDVASGSWSGGTAMTSARANAAAVVVNDKIHVLGGSTGNAGVAWAGSTTTYEYSPGGGWNTKTVFSAANLSERLLFAMNDVIYNFGGRTTAAAPATTADGFSVTLNNTTTGSTEVALTAGRTGHAGVLYTPGVGPAMIAIVGGFSALTATTGNFVAQGTTASTPTSLFQYLYYPFTAPAVWTNPPNQYPLSVGFTAASIYGSRMYVFGGTSAVTGAAIGLNNCYSFDLGNLNGSWSSFTSMPVGRYGHAAVTYRP